MDNITRQIDVNIANHFSKYKEILILLGARQVGKTTLLKRLYPDAQYLLCDNDFIRTNLEKYDISVYRQLISPQNKLVVIDEIQLLSNPGRAAKILYDQIPNLRLVITGSSALMIKHTAIESLAGRKIDYHLYPLTFSEYLVQQQIESTLTDKIFTNQLGEGSPQSHPIYPYDLSSLLETVLLYGLYPGMISHPSDSTYLTNLVDAVLLKDLLDLHLIEERSRGLQLLRLLAYQIGNLVNMSEIADRLDIDVKTVKRYILLFTESFIIFPIYPYAKSGRDEIGKMPKIYFWDLGIRNALIQNFQPLAVRPDTGALFENFIISECKKINIYGNYGHTFNYWRTRQGSEIDMVLTRGQTLIGVEIKFTKGKINRSFSTRYPNAQLKLVTSKSFFA